MFRSQGIGEALVKRSLDGAREAGGELVILVGDEPYYSRMGFRARRRRGSSFPARSIRRGCSIANCSRARSRASRGRSAPPEGEGAVFKE